MALPTPPAFSDPIPNPSPTIPNTAPEYLVKGPYWYMKIADAGISVTLTGDIKRTGSSTTYPTAGDAEIKGTTGHYQIGQGMSVVGGQSFQVGTGAGVLDYFVYTEQGPLLLGDGFAVTSGSGELVLN